MSVATPLRSSLNRLWSEYEVLIRLTAVHISNLCTTNCHRLPTTNWTTSPGGSREASKRWRSRLGLVRPFLCSRPYSC